MKRNKFPNLAAEQARKGYNDSDVAAILNISRQSYTNRKYRGDFKMSEAKKLCELFEKEFMYLFEKEA